MAAVEQDRDVRLVRGNLRDQDRELLVREVVAARTAAVGADQAFVPAVGKGLAKRGIRRPVRPVSAELEQGDVTGSRLTQVRPEATDDVGAGGVAVLQDLDGERRRGDLALQVLVEEVDVVEASIERLDFRPVVVDAHEQRVHPVRHSRTDYVA